MTNHNQTTQAQAKANAQTKSETLTHWQLMREQMAQRHGLPLDFSEVDYLAKHCTDTNTTTEINREELADVLANISVHLMNYYQLANFIADNYSATITGQEIEQATSRATLINMIAPSGEQLIKQLADALHKLTPNRPENWREQAREEWAGELAEMRKKDGIIYIN